MSLKLRPIILMHPKFIVIITVLKRLDISSQLTLILKDYFIVNNNNVQVN